MTEDSLNEPVSLAAFGHQFQQAIIGLCVTNAQFLMNCRNNVEYGWFISTVHQDLMKIIYEIYDAKKGSVSSARLPTEAEITAKLTWTFPKMSDLEARKSELAVCCLVAKGNHYSFEWLTEQMTGWIRMVKLQILIRDAKKQYNKKEFDRCIGWINTKMNDIRQTSFGGDMYFSFSDPVTMLKNFGKTLEADCCTFGHPDMDDLIKPGSKLRLTQDSQVLNVKKMTKGSLMPGDLTVLMGPTNSGKTTTVVTTAAMNILMGKYVGLITHEQNAEQLAVKILGAMMRTPLNDLVLKSPYNEDAIRVLEYLAQLLQKHLRFIHYAIPGKMFVEDVMQIVENMQEEVVLYRASLVDPVTRERLDTSGRGLDLLIEDYPAKLKAKALGKGSQIWDERAYVYNEFLNAGQTYGFHVFAPVQTNRQGFRIGRGDTRDNRPVDVDDVAEGFGVVQIAANVITINRSNADKSMKTIRFHIAKSRSSETGHQLIMRTAFDQSIAFDITQPTVQISPGEEISEAIMAQRLGIIKPDEKTPAQLIREQGVQKVIDQVLNQTPGVQPEVPVVQSDGAR